MLEGVLLRGRLARPWGGTHLGTNVAALGPQLVDLGLGDVRPLLRLVQLMLHLAELGQVGVGLLLLQGFRGREDEVRGGRGRDSQSLSLGNSCS